MWQTTTCKGYKSAYTHDSRWRELPHDPQRINADRVGFFLTEAAGWVTIR